MLFALILHRKRFTLTSKQTRKGVCWNCQSKTIIANLRRCKLYFEKNYCNLHSSPSNEHRALLTNYFLAITWQAQGSHFSVKHQRFQLCVAVVVPAHVREPYLWILGLNRELNLFSLSKAVQQDPVSTSSQSNQKYKNTCAVLRPTPTQDCREHKRTPSENGPVLEEKGDRKKATESNSGSSSPRSLRTYGRYVVSAKNTRTEHEDSHTNAHGGTCWRVTEQTVCTKQFRDHGGP